MKDEQSMSTRDHFRSAYARLEHLCPDRLRQALGWLSEPAARPARIPLAVLCIIGGCFSFLPVLGIELFPLGFMLLAHDIKSLRAPAGRMTMWMLDRYQRGGRYLLVQHARWTAWCTWVATGRKYAKQEAPSLPGEGPCR